MNDNDQPNDQATVPADRLRMGDALISIFRRLGEFDLDVARDRTPMTPIGFD